MFPGKENLGILKPYKTAVSKELFIHNRVLEDLAGLYVYIYINIYILKEAEKQNELGYFLQIITMLWR